MSVHARVMRGAAGAAVAIACAASSAASADDPKGYVVPPKVSDAKLSPSGQRLAVIIANEKGNPSLAVMDLPPAAPPRVLQSYPRAQVEYVRWVNDDRLVFRVTEPSTWMREDGSGLFAIDHDGGNERLLTSWRAGNDGTETRIRSRVLPYSWDLHRTLDDGSADVLLGETVFDAVGDAIGMRLGRVDTLSGTLKPIVSGAAGALAGIDWAFDRDGTVRVLRTRSRGRDRLLARVPDADEWRTLRERELFADDVLSPVQLEGAHELVVAGAVGGDTRGLHLLDLRNGEIDPEPLLRVARHDVGDAIVDPRAGRVVGAHLTADRPMTVWFSDRMAAIQQAVDRALPDRFNRVSCGRCESSRFFVVFSESDRHPGEFLLYDDQKKSLSPIGVRRPWLDPATQGRRSFHWIAARDGLPLPVVVTHPAGSDAKQALPAVVLVHGGPWVEGADRSWSAWAQFLAARGWRVVEPNFRGTLGYGNRHFAASWKQWGQAMQDDLADAVAWAAKESLVDPERVCIVGASYGGYAALMGPIRHPGVYRCAASFAGVTDIRLKFTSARSDVSRDSRRYEMRQLVGDPEQDAATLRANSPVERAGEIGVPVLLAHGGQDRRVPKEHADAFESAARKAGVKIERVDYPEEGHGFVEADSYADFLNRLAAFLERSLGR